MTAKTPESVVQARRWALSGGHGAWGVRAVPEETAVAFTYNRSSYAVMMATPADLEDFGIGFSLSEGIIASPREITALEIVPSDLGVEIRMDLEPSRAAHFTERRRRMAGPVGCGLCGMESLKDTIRPTPVVTGEGHVKAHTVTEAVSALGQAQALNRETHAVHAAGFFVPSEGLVLLREDVGRHNALDKLAGTLARSNRDAAQGIIVISSRVSVEMVQKAAVMGAPILAAVSAPTALAIRTAEQAGITLAAVARTDGFEVFTRSERITPDAKDNVA